jgi:predicted RNA-binding protein with PIN domain
VAYLIDGNNFIGHSSPAELRDPQSKHRLVLKLQKFQRQKKTRVLVVFDGSPDPDFIDEKFRKKYFSVIFPSFDQNADEVIKEIISKQTDLRRFFVVSSDREIKNFAKAKGAKSLSCEEFERELKSMLKEHRESKADEKKVAPPSSLEINQWLKIFKNKK